MSTVKSTDVVNNGPLKPSDLAQAQQKSPPTFSNPASYKGFLAGVFSGVAKLTVGHPFDTIKVRLQTSQSHQFSGPLSCLASTLRNEGVRGLYKGASPPLFGWILMDSCLMGSLTLYRRILKENVFTNPRCYPNIPLETLKDRNLPAWGHGLAGMFAGATVSFIAAPVEHIKARLQVQYQVDKHSRLYKGPIDACNKILRSHGIYNGLYKGLTATLIFRSFFFFWWSSYDIITRSLKKNTSLSTPAVNFWAGGLSAQVFWLTSFPSDVIKQRIMTDKLGGTHGDGGAPRYKTWRQAATSVYRENGWKGYWRGFVPAITRAFPANAVALVVFEAVMRAIPDHE